MLLCSNELFVVLAGIRSLSLNVRYRGQPRQHMLVLSITGFDPAKELFVCAKHAAKNILAGEQSACRSQIKLMYGSHHQQPQKDCRYDELDPYLVVREPSMHMIEPIHGQPPSGYHAPPNPNTLSHPTVDGGPCTLFVPTPAPGSE